ncbi:S8 family serine peptidase [Actinokineospora sp. HUAS TT18]|uniref:S8 family serine peptidase n=1 Tax=Actinokineospora sp. HUAS TT18 TaxID=3447451 RepID=UPI003F51E91F
MIGVRRAPQLDLVRLTSVRRRGAGSADVAVGLVATEDDITALAGVLAADPLSLCPLCPVLPRTLGDDLVAPLADLLDGPTRVIVVGSAGPEEEVPGLDETLDRAAEAGVLVVAPGGPLTALTCHPWVLPVVSCAPSGRVSWFVDLEEDPRGLLAPGEDLPGPTGPATGNGVAAALVAGAAALLWSLHPDATGHRIRAALSIGAVHARRSGPPLLDAERAHEFLARVVVNSG